MRHRTNCRGRTTNSSVTVTVTETVCKRITLTARIIAMMTTKILVHSQQSPIAIGFDVVRWQCETGQLSLLPHARAYNDCKTTWQTHPRILKGYHPPNLASVQPTVNRFLQFSVQIVRNCKPNSYENHFTPATCFLAFATMHDCYVDRLWRITRSITKHKFHKLHEIKWPCHIQAVN